MNANELADEVEMWGKDLLALNMKGGIPVIEGAKMLRQQQEQINNLKQWEKRQLDLIESLELQLHTTLTNRNLEKPAKYSDAWWKEVAEFNKARKAQKK